MGAREKEPGALLTIGELSSELGVGQHILRYWETRFPQLRPMQRAGNRRYYRPSDVDLVRRINRLLNQEGYTVRGVQKLLRDKDSPPAETAAEAPQPDRAEPAMTAHATTLAADERPAVDLFRLISLRDRLASAIDL